MRSWCGPWSAARPMRDRLDSLPHTLRFYQCEKVDDGEEDESLGDGRVSYRAYYQRARRWDTLAGKTAGPISPHTRIHSPKSARSQ
jgi:hypothetical protein